MISISEKVTFVLYGVCNKCINMEPDELKNHKRTYFCKN